MTLPVAIPLAPALVIALATAIAFGAGGAWLGWSLHAGREALEERAELYREIDALESAAKELRQRGLSVAQDFRSAYVRFETISQGLSHDLASLDVAFATHRADIESLLAAHPEWAGCDIGADGVRAWNAAAAGLAAHAAATVDPGSAAADLRAAPAAADGQQPAGTDAELRAGGGAIPPVPLRNGIPDARAGDL